MPKPSPKFKFGDWSPDLPELDNPGLIEAANTVWSGGAYRSYSPLVATSAALPGGKALAAYRFSSPGGTPPDGIFAMSTDGSAHTYLSYAASGFSFIDITPNITGTGLFASDRACFTQFGDRVFVTYGTSSVSQNAPLVGPAGGVTPVFVVLSGPDGFAPNALYCGVVGQFLVLVNNTTTPNFSAAAIQWSGINAPLNWPAPNSAQAIAEQSGAQTMDVRLGAANGISGADQWGIVLMEGGIVRMTYAGGAVVFQFDTIYRGPGNLTQSGWVKIGGIVYFISAIGILSTDGSQVQNISDGKLNKWLTDNADFGFPLAFDCGVDYKRKVIFWTFPLLGHSGVPNAWIAFNYAEGKFSHGSDTVSRYFRGNEPYATTYGIQAFNTAASCGNFTGTPGTAVFTSPEIEFNSGGQTLVQGVMPQISGSSPVISVRVGSRNAQGDAVTFSAADTPDSFTQSANFLVDNRYHRAEISVAGAFDKAIGGEFDATPSSPL
jgi:hypothetical protein